jgi:hypothetical protein
MNKFLACIALVSLLLPLELAAQYRTCATMQQLAQMQNQDPTLRRRMDQIESNSRMVAKMVAPGVQGVITIPVVVHVIYRTEAQKISDAQILSQIEVLNEDFGRANSDRNQTPALFQEVAGNPNIRFALATRDPQGQPTSGITRTASEVFSFTLNDNTVKTTGLGGQDPWPTGEYLNIWVCNLAFDLLGYAQFPGGTSATDGVVISYKFFGRYHETRPPFDLGRTATHEIGHWLNLRHIWGDGPCGTDDNVADTPEAAAPNVGCVRENFSCGSQDMVSNFMDYTDDACMNLFTRGQAERMRSLFAPGGARASLLSSQGLNMPRPVASNAPAILQVTNVAQQAVTLSWSSVPGASSYEVRFRPVGTPQWVASMTTGTTVSISRLQMCTPYEYQVKSVTPYTSSAYSPSSTFNTQGCSCEAPETLYVSNMSNSHVTLSWEPAGMAAKDPNISYMLQFRQSGSRRIFSKVVQGNSTTITGLTPGYLYQYRLKTLCEGETGGFSRVESFVLTSENARVARRQDYMRVYPSPNMDKVTIEVDLPEMESIHILLKDASGQELSRSPSFASNAGPFTLDVSNRPGGLYYIEVEDDQGFQHVREVRVSR